MATEETKLTKQKRRNKRNLGMKDLKKEVQYLKELMQNQGVELTPMTAAAFSLQDTLPETIQPFYDQFRSYLANYRGRSLSRKLKVALADKFMRTTNPEYDTMTSQQRAKYMDLLLLDDFWDELENSAKNAFWNAVPYGNMVRPFMPEVNFRKKIQPLIGMTQEEDFVPQHNPAKPELIPSTGNEPWRDPEWWKTATQEQIERAMYEKRGEKYPYDEMEKPMDKTVSVNRAFTVPFADLTPAKSVAFSGGSMESVDTQALMTIFNPEVYSSRLPLATTQRTALARYTQQVTFATNASGAAGFWFIPDNVGSLAFVDYPAGTGTTTNQYPPTGMFYVYNGTDFNPVTGAATTASNIVNSDLSMAGTSGNRPVTRFQLVASSLEIYAVSSLTNLQGNVEVCYFDSMGDVFNQTVTYGTGTNNNFYAPFASRSSLPQQAAYVTKPARDRVRVIHNPGPDGADNLSASIAVSSQSGNSAPVTLYSVNSYLSDFIYILVTSAANTTFNVVMNFVVQYVVNPTYLPMVDLQMCGQAAATFPVLVAAFARHPALLMLSREEVRELCAALSELPRYAHYNEVYHLLCTFGTRLPAVEYVQQPIIVKDTVDESFEL